ncbi:hypothetical protein CF088_13145 [Clostridium botulinum]|uniref:hypothetical protein n=1 Tax=Clostridium botulinum TaxID=1491 RepID=UPI0007731DC9|nr:hypothetical protein [Clostridium botulinum]APH22477.1 hypothetical protein NPD1_3374 [Clostridium botulinum]APQ69357.1 hypothetical protein RSJ8_1500 [Clostridium botulinum]MBN3380877.1 hypothetical protein [Clostridium botulinum]MBN3406210.1 hypothetical protein [Clostridium botulinum]
MNKIKGKEIEENNSRECFVIMPIGDKEGYSKGHFKRVYEDIFKPAIEKAEFKPYRADDSNASHLIQIDIIKRVIEAPMAICDLSTRNPNVLFELGIRQAFDKPVVLVQEVGTERIFDINSINTHEYRKERVYNEVLEDQEKICDMIKDTFEKHTKGECVNSLVKLINIQPAKNIDGNVQPNDMMKIILNEVIDLKKQVHKENNCNKYYIENAINNEEVESIVKRIDSYCEQFEKTIEIYSCKSIDEYIFHLTSIRKGVINLSRKCDLNYITIPSNYKKKLMNLRTSIEVELEKINSNISKE